MKKILVVVFTVIAHCLTLSACAPKEGQIENVKITIGTSDKFNKEKIEEAIDRIKEKFISDFKGCELLQLWYDEKSSDQQIESYIRSGNGSKNGVSGENVIIILSNFKAGSGADMTFHRNTIYEDWMWILIRDSESDTWRIDDWGY